jgi:hypothetical protein
MNNKNKILDKKLYEKVKKEIYKTYKKPSAYRSGAVVKRYKQLGGKYSGDKKKGSLTRWFREKWKDIGDKNYPVYRPTKRITKKTPLLVSEISSKNLKKQIELKQRIKGLKNLPPFKKKKKSRSKKFA